MRSRVVTEALVFALAGAVCRLTFEMTRTRWQIAVVIAAAAAWQMLRAAAGRRFSGRQLLLDGAAGSVAMIVVKVALEHRLT